MKLYHSPYTTGVKVWIKTGVPGLYLHGPSKGYYLRFQLNGKRTFRTLKTKVYAVARVKAKEMGADIEKSRTKVRAPAECRTMGDLAELMLTRIRSAELDPSTIRNYEMWYARLVANWPAGKFETTLPSSVNEDLIIKLRERLQGAQFKIRNTRRFRKGYAPAVINQTLSFLRLLTALAKEKHLIFVDPFEEKTGPGSRLYLKKTSRKPTLPNRRDMDRIFTAMAHVPNPERYDNGRLDYLHEQAVNASEHARFLAFTGCRLEEANGVRWEDISDTMIKIRGTKTSASDRTVPMVPQMVRLVEEMRARRLSKGMPVFGQVLRVRSCLQAMQRACFRLELPKLWHHALRHYFITVCIESGVDIPTIAGWVGHTDGGALLMKTYSHVRNEHSMRQAQRVTFAPVPVEAVG